jgi:hypothetical protein
VPERIVALRLSASRASHAKGRQNDAIPGPSRRSEICPRKPRSIPWPVHRILAIFLSNAPHLAPALEHRHVESGVPLLSEARP